MTWQGGQQKVAQQGRRRTWISKSISGTQPAAAMDSVTQSKDSSQQPRSIARSTFTVRRAAWPRATGTTRCVVPLRFGSRD